MSEFIERSKHKGMTAMAEAHIMRGEKPDATMMSAEDAKGYNDTNALPPPPSPEPFNITTGVNYMPPSHAGHKTGGR